jgi:probable phosphoglycerate mutase
LNPPASAEIADTVPPEPTRILAIRHGETAWNAEMRLQGQLDVPLNALGRWQASRLPAAIADERLVAVYASDLVRAHETARTFAAPLGLPVVADRGLRERCFGHFEGRTYAEIDIRWPQDAERWRERETGYAPYGGESLETFYQRCVSTVTRLAGAHPGQTIAIVAHGGVLDCLHRAALRVELTAPRAWPLANATVNRLLFTGEGLMLIGWNDDAHLAGGDPAGLRKTGDDASVT